MADGDLVQLKIAAERIQQLSDQNWSALQGTIQLLADKVWLGPIARRFSGDLNHRNAELQSQLRQAVNAAQQAVHLASKDKQ